MDSGEMSYVYLRNKSLFIICIGTSLITAMPEIVESGDNFNLDNGINGQMVKELDLLKFQLLEFRLR
jgi:hypothetical protein